MMTLLGIFLITYMLTPRFAAPAHEVRLALTDKVASEVVDDDVTRSALADAVAALPVPEHKVGIDPPYSRTSNPDTEVFHAVHGALMTHAPDPGTANRLLQEFKSLYNQMMLPSLLGSLFNPLFMGLFMLLMIMLLLSTDASRIFNSSSTIVQDLVLPLKKEPMPIEGHLSAIKRTSLLITLLFFVISLFLTHLDYINMFTTIVTAVWLGAAGPIMVGGLYTRFGTTAGAWSSLAVGSGIPIVGLILQRTWANSAYPWLERLGLAEPLGRFLEAISSPFNPWIVWTMDPVKFPINSIEIYFLAMLCSIGAYVGVSRLTMKEPYNLDRMLHRGIYSDGETTETKAERVTWETLVQKVVGIDREYTTGDKVIAWSVVIYSLGWSVGVMFVGVLIWNAISPWNPEHWAMYFFITVVVTGLIVGTISTVWFLIGGTIDTYRLFRDLRKRVANPLDDGRVEGHVSAVDLARVRQIEGRRDDAE
jgi:Na+/proline symporter